MSNDKGIFDPKEGFASEEPARSPFAVDKDAESPFASGADSKSPFAVDKGAEAKPAPEKSDPFGNKDSKSPFGYEPPVAGFGGSPFEGSPAPSPAKDSPFGVAEEKPEAKKEEAASPFTEQKSDAVASALAAASGTPQPAPAAEEKPAPAPAASTPASTPAPEAATPPPTPAASSFGDEEEEPKVIRQLELRAIFGVDRELSESEMLQRSRSLPGIRHLGRVATEDISILEGVKKVLANLDFGGGKVQIQCNNTPVEFIREGSVLLAVQTDGSYAPGVRETLMIVARELGRM